MSFFTARKVVVATTVCATALAAFWSSHIYSSQPWYNFFSPTKTPPFVCISHQYSTEIISVDPLVIYINDFISHQEAKELIEAGKPNLQLSEVFLRGRKRPSTERTSKSAGLPVSHPAVQCVLSRSREFMGTTLAEKGDFGIPQMVHYEAGERFDLHRDWYDKPQRLKDGRWFNRIASFLVYLEDGCTEGQTYFPSIEGLEKTGQKTVERATWKRHDEGGTVFRPVRGNALFWMNLFPNGTGDERVRHAGLPIGEGVKTAMNIWPMKFY